MLDSALCQTLALSFAAGLAIPVGGVLARFESIGPAWLETEFRHGVIAFGGGALLGAVAFILVPDAVEKLSLGPAMTAFLVGSLVFFAADRLVECWGGSAAQLLAMLLDFLPEALALGAAFAVGNGNGGVIAFFIALQNLPEGFNAFREMHASGKTPSRRILLLFVTLSLLGPLSAWLGYTVLAEHPTHLGLLMMGCSGGILFAVFDDIAPSAHLERHWLPSFGAVLGFALALAGHLLTNAS